MFSLVIIAKPSKLRRISVGWVETNIRTVGGQVRRSKGSGFNSCNRALHEVKVPGSGGTGGLRSRSFLNSVFTTSHSRLVGCLDGCVSI
jgi:hypothetical protein